MERRAWSMEHGAWSMVQIEERNAKKRDGILKGIEMN